MALTGIDIFKFLPKTNCGECGIPTCLAFAMKLAARQLELAACPYVSDEAKPYLHFTFTSFDVFDVQGRFAEIAREFTEQIKTLGPSQLKQAA